MNIEISQIYWIYDYIWIYVYLNKIYFLLETMISYDFWTNWLWINSDTQTNGGYLLVFWYPNQWGLFIGILIPKPLGVVHWCSDTQPMGVVHWCSDTQTNGGRSLVIWYPNQWGLFIGTLIPKPMGGCSLVFWYPNQWGLFIGTLMPSHGDIAWL